MTELNTVYRLKADDLDKVLTNLYSTSFLKFRHYKSRSINIHGLYYTELIIKPLADDLIETPSRHLLVHISECDGISLEEFEGRVLDAVYDLWSETITKSDFSRKTVMSILRALNK